MSSIHSYQPQILKMPKHIVPAKDFKQRFVLNIAVTQGEISEVDLKSAGKSAG